MKVIDASALVKFLLKEEGWERVLEHLEAGAVSVDLVFKEAANAVWRATRADIKKARPMLEALGELAESVVKAEDEKGHLGEAIRIAFSGKITVYDALYLALAKTSNRPIVTADGRQLEMAEKLRIHAIAV